MRIKFEIINKLNFMFKHKSYHKLRNFVIFSSDEADIIKKIHPLSNVH